MVTGFPKVDVYEADACHDLDVVVSPKLVATATNSGHVVFYKKDGSMDHVHDFSACCGDQHLQWDDSTQRWFFNVMNGVSNGGPDLVFASTDDTGTNWTSGVTVTIDDGTGQPASVDDIQLVVTTDKVLLENGDCIYPLDKTSVMTGGGTATPTGSCGLGHDDQVWAVHNGYPEPSTGYFVTMSDDQHLNWISVDGTGTAITVQQHMLPVSGFTKFPVGPGVPQPPGPMYPMGSSLRASGVIGMWQNSDLWWSAVDYCSGGSMLSCQRMFHVRTDTNTETDFDFAVPNVYVWSAAPGIDANGNMWALMSETSSTLFPSLAVGGYSAGGTTTQPHIVFQGTQSDETGNPLGDWGDFFACDQDPTDGSLWCLGNYGGAPVNGCNTPAKLVHVTTQ
jgi:hypothetical protein